VSKNWLKNSHPFGKKCQKTAGGDFFDSHCRKTSVAQSDVLSSVSNKFLSPQGRGHWVIRWYYCNEIDKPIQSDVC